jgi:hypothetical protein
VIDLHLYIRVWLRVFGVLEEAIVQDVCNYHGELSVSDHAFLDPFEEVLHSLIEVCITVSSEGILGINLNLTLSCR